ncbi:uncharacterized protein LOC135431952 isoform X1 [Drosophila montana]|uniref:uncharacterized protein LOC135431952 isoform X1 n=1 Tax=Drosophila montana TaxID=40370 RepID=UPI00313D2104
MRCLMLLTFLILAMLAVSARAGKVTIKGECVDCNRPDAATTTTRRPSTAHGGHGRATTPKPKPKSHKASDDSDEDLSMGDWNLSQGAHGAQHISSGSRHKRQRQVIITDSGFGGGGWSGGRVTTLDSRGRPGTVVRNDDCVGCNING